MSSKAMRAARNTRTIQESHTAASMSFHESSTKYLVAEIGFKRLVQNASYTTSKFGVRRVCTYHSPCDSSPSCACDSRWVRLGPYCKILRLGSEPEVCTAPVSSTKQNVLRSLYQFLVNSCSTVATPQTRIYPVSNIVAVEYHSRFLVPVPGNGNVLYTW